MPCRPRAGLSLMLAAIVSALLLAAGCTTTVTGSPVADPAPAPTEGPGSDPVLWVDRVCGALLSFLKFTRIVSAVGVGETAQE